MQTAGKGPLPLASRRVASGRRAAPRSCSHARGSVAEPAGSEKTSNRGGLASTSGSVSSGACGAFGNGVAAVRNSTRSPKPQPTEEQKRLNQSITNAADPWAVLALVDAADLEQMSLVNLVTAFQRVAKRSTRLSSGDKARLLADARLRALSEAVMARSDAWGGYAVSNLAWAHQVLRHGRPGMTALLTEKLLAKLPNMTPPEVGGSLMALTKIRPLEPSFFERLGPLLLDWLAARQAKYGAALQERCLNGVLWSYAKCGHTPDAELLTALAAAAKASLQERLLQRRGLATMVWAFARLEHLDSDLYDRLAAEALTHLPERPPKSLSEADASALAFDLANLAWGFGRAHALLVGATEPEFGRDDGLYSEHMQRVPVRALVLARVSRHLLPVASHLNMPGLSSVLYGLAVIRHYDAALMGRLSRLLRQQVPSLNLLAVAVAFWSLSTLRHDAPETYEALAGRALQLLGDRSLRKNTNEQVLNMILMACACADLAHLRNCRRLARELAGLVSERGVAMLDTGQGLANVAWSLACLGLLDGALLRQICVALTRRRDVTPRVLTQVYQADLALALSRQRPSKDTSAVDVSEFLEECFSLGALKVASRRHWNQMLSQTWRSVTDLHWQVATALQALGGRFRVEYEAEDYSVDIALEQERIAIEVDGPTHFSRNTRRPLGFHAFKKRLLGLRSWRVVNVPYYEWSEQRTDEQRQRYLAGLLAGVGWEPPSRHLAAAPIEGESQAAAEGQQEAAPQLHKPQRPPAEELRTFRDLSAGDKLALLRHGAGRGGSKHKLLLERAARRRK